MLNEHLNTIFMALAGIGGVIAVMYAREKTITERINVNHTHSIETRNWAHTEIRKVESACVSRDEMKSALDTALNPMRHDISELRHQQEQVGKRQDEIVSLLLKLTKPEKLT